MIVQPWYISALPQKNTSTQTIIFDFTQWTEQIWCAICGDLSLQFFKILHGKCQHFETVDYPGVKKYRVPKIERPSTHRTLYK